MFFADQKIITEDDRSNAGTSTSELKELYHEPLSLQVFGAIDARCCCVAPMSNSSWSHAIEAVATKLKRVARQLAYSHQCSWSQLRLYDVNVQLLEACLSPHVMKRLAVVL